MFLDFRKIVALILGYNRFILVISFLIITISSCNLDNNKIKEPLFVLIDSLTVDINNIKSFSTIPIKYKDRFFFIDDQEGNVVELDQQYNFNRIVASNGRGPGELSAFLTLDIVDSLLLVKGNVEYLVYDLESLELTGKFKTKVNYSSENLIYDNFSIYRFGYCSDNLQEWFGDKFYLFKEELNPSDGFYDINPVNTQPFESGLTGDLSFYNTLLLHPKGSSKIFVVLKWLGEVCCYDINTGELIFQKELPNFGSKSQMKYFIEEDDYIPYYQASSADVLSDSLLLLMREVDFETIKSLRDDQNMLKTFRKKVELYDENLNLLYSQLLDRHAIEIKLVDNKFLLARPYSDSDILYIYKINHEVLRSIINPN